jgi:hypothetical protein
MILSLDLFERPIRLLDLEYGPETILMIRDLAHSARSLEYRILIVPSHTPMILSVARLERLALSEIRTILSGMDTILPLSSLGSPILMDDRQTTSMLVVISSELIILILLVYSHIS